MFLRYTKLFNYNIKDAVELHRINPKLTEMKYGKIENFDTKNVTDFSGLFQSSNCDFDLSNWDVSNATTTMCMFRNCVNFTGKINGWNLYNNKDASHMFDGCIRLKDFPYTLVMDNVRNAEWMFYNCKSLEGQSLINCHTHNLRNASYMFYNCINLRHVLYWDINQLKVTDKMFYGCSSMEEKYNNNEYLLYIVNKQPVKRHHK